MENMKTESEKELIRKSRQLKAEHKAEWMAKQKEERGDLHKKRKGQFAVRMRLIRECLKDINSYDGQNTWKYMFNNKSRYYKVVEYCGSELVREEFKSKSHAEVCDYLIKTRQFILTHPET
jgi:hypothetical protein